MGIETAMEKVKLDYWQSGHRNYKNKNQRGKQLQSQQHRTLVTYFKTMFKLENITILVLILLAHQIHGIHSQGKQRNSGCLFLYFFLYLRFHSL